MNRERWVIRISSHNRENQEEWKRWEETLAEIHAARADKNNESVPQKQTKKVLHLKNLTVNIRDSQQKTINLLDP